MRDTARYALVGQRRKGNNNDGRFAIEDQDLWNESYVKESSA